MEAPENFHCKKGTKGSSDCTAAAAAKKVTARTKPVRRMTLTEWTVFPVDSSIPDLPLPQQAEAEICLWLKFIVRQLGMVDNKQGRLYGTIIFDPMGDLFDFNIKRLQLSMLDPGFNNWMNTLASGEVLLDIVNGLINFAPEDNCSSVFLFPGKKDPLSVRRMLATAPNKLAICAFLLNFDCLFEEFLLPTLQALRPGELAVDAGAPSDAWQAMRNVRHIGHTLLRNSYTTREWTWKALMLVVMTLMALTGCLGEGLGRLYCCLTGESDLDRLLVRELQFSYSILKSSQVFVPSDDSGIENLVYHFPYQRVLKQGDIKFRSLLSADFNLD